jgi:glycosyltransferase involved in cell wall biosynthesis
VVTGRLCWIKGWELLLEAVKILKCSIFKIRLIFVGDGEDRASLEKKASLVGLTENVQITGFISQFEVVKYINASDVCIVGSYQEGWSLAMCEIIACGKTLVSTDVSGARDMVHNGRNGFVVMERTPEVYAKAIMEAMQLPNAKIHSLQISERYALKNLAKDLGSLWGPLAIE